MKTRNEMKTRLKELGAEIRQNRLNFKNAQREGGEFTEPHKERSSLEIGRSTFRHLHIAYGIARGKQYNEIERTTREGNEPSWTLINKFIENLESRGE